MKVRKKPVTVDAWRVADLLDLVALGNGQLLPPEVREAVSAGAVNLALPNRVFVKTLEGKMRGDRGGWLIRGVKGEFYPCKPDVFDETYEVMKS